MAIEGNQLATFGDIRRQILSDITAVRDGSLSVSQGQVVAVLYKELHTNVQTEINAAKMALATEGKAHNFGRIVGMGQRLIGNDSTQPSA